MRAVAERRLLLLTSAGNRSLAQFEAVADLVAPAFDRFVLYDDPKYRRHRAVGEVPALLAEALVAKGIARDRIACADSIEEGLARISALSAPGDFVLLVGGRWLELEAEVARAFAPHRRPL